MANRNTSGFGLIAAGTVGSTPATQGQGKYYIIEAMDAGAADLFQGCSVSNQKQDTLLKHLARVRS